MRFHQRFAVVLSLSLAGLQSLPVLASSEMRGIAIVAAELYRGPGEDYGTNGEKVDVGADVYILGTSVGGAWLRVAIEDGDGSGWIPAKVLKLERVLPSEVYRIKERMYLEGRYQSVLQLDLGLASGSMPFGKGAVLSGTINFAPGGVFGVNKDQVEFGGSVGYFLGQEVFGYIEDDDTRYSLNPEGSRKFLNFALFGQWLFRSGDRGAFMLGPRVGFMITPYGYDDLYHYPITGGLAFRYYSEEHFGWFGTAMVALESSWFFFYTFGMSLRY